MDKIIQAISSNPAVCVLKGRFIVMCRFALKRGKYKLVREDGTNNLLLNFVDFVFLLIYCGLSGYNVYKTFDVSKPPSYLVFTLNIANLTRYYISNMVKVRDIKNEYLKKHRVDIGNVDVPSAGFRTIVECLSLCVSVIFIIIGRLFGKDILGIRSASVVALVSVVIVICTGIEGIISIASNMFKAEPRIFIDSEKEKEGDQGC